MKTKNTPDQIAALAALVAVLGRTDGTRLFRAESSDEKHNAQRNLSGRTHYADDETLRFFSARILSARDKCEGLIFRLVESTAADMHNQSRGFRVVLFDVFGTVIERPTLQELSATRKAAEKHADALAAELDLCEHYAREIASRRRRAQADLLALETAAAALAPLAPANTAATLAA